MAVRDVSRLVCQRQFEVEENSLCLVSWLRLTGMRLVELISGLILACLVAVLSTLCAIASGSECGRWR